MTQVLPALGQRYTIEIIVHDVDMVRRANALLLCEPYSKRSEYAAWGPDRLPMIADRLALAGAAGQG